MNKVKYMCMSNGGKRKNREKQRVRELVRQRKLKRERKRGMCNDGRR